MKIVIAKYNIFSPKEKKKEKKKRKFFIKGEGGGKIRNN